MTIVVPRGAEAAAVRKAKPDARIIEIRAGSGAADHLPPIDKDEIVVVLGLCGALREAKVGDVLVYREIVTADGTIEAPYWRQLETMFAARVVRASSVDHVVTTISERTAIAAADDTDAVDMESRFLADELRRREVVFGIARIVSDDATSNIPAIDRVITAKGGLNVPRLLLAFLRAPRATVRFIRNVRRALRCLTGAATIAATASRTAA